MGNLIHTIKFGLKLLTRDRGFTIATVMTLAICVGANIAVFTIVNSVLLQPLPVPESDRILLIADQFPSMGVGLIEQTSIPHYYDRRRDTTVFEEQAMFGSEDGAIQINGVPRLVRAMSATPSLFRLIGIPPAVGRVFQEEEGEAGNNDVAVLGYSLWQDLFGADTGAVGRQIDFGGRKRTIVGIMPRDFLFLDPEVRLWIPFAFTREQKSDLARLDISHRHIGRLKPGTTIEQARTQIDAINAANLERYPGFRPMLENLGFYTSVDRLEDVLVRDVRATLYLLWGGAAFVLLIGAINIGGLTLVRTRARSKELATRLALGASRGAIVRQLVAENVILSAAGSTAGLLVGWITLRVLAAALDRLPRAAEIQMNGAVFLFALGLSVMLGVSIGAAAAGRRRLASIYDLLQESGRASTAGRGARATRRLLAAAQVGIAFVLLTAAGLLLYSFQAVMAIDPGFNLKAITAATSLDPSRYVEDAGMRGFMQRTLDALRALPTVASAGAASHVPFGDDIDAGVILAEGYRLGPKDIPPPSADVIVTPGYFEAMGMPIIQGRNFDSRDSSEGAPAVIVDESLARRFWPGADPVGKRMYIVEDDRLVPDENTRWLSVIGVARNVRLLDLTGEYSLAGTFYRPYTQKPVRSIVFTIRTDQDTTPLVPALRAALQSVDRELPLFDIRTMDERRRMSVATERTAMLLAAAFGATALLLAVVGVYAVIAYNVAQRRREIGIRIAMGSTTGQIFALVMKEGFRITGFGLVLGFSGAYLLSGLIAEQLYAVAPMDPLVMGAVFALLGTVALLASALPARRAMRVDPSSVLNRE